MMTIAATNLSFGQNAQAGNAVSVRLAIYYGYPSLVNEARGDVAKAASVFSAYDVVVLGDGLEFADVKQGRYPEGDPGEHLKSMQIIAAVQKRSPTTRFYGYICLGEIPWPKGQQTVLSLQLLQERIELWKQMGVSGIFLDEAGYDYAAVTRERQNFAVRTIHELGLSAFMNAYFIDHLFSPDDNLPHSAGTGKNPKHLAALLDRRDLFLLESFQVKSGAYESIDAAQSRIDRALGYRRQFGSKVFATTTTTVQEPFNGEKFNYAWWTARLYGLDGFSWGEPEFSALNNLLPDRRCATTTVPPFEPRSAVQSDGEHLWRKAGPYLVVVDTEKHTVRRILQVDRVVEAKSIPALLSPSPKNSPLTCEGAAE